jgi:hypothetical protein
MTEPQPQMPSRVIDTNKDEATRHLNEPVPAPDDPGGGRAKGYAAEPPAPPAPPRREGVVSDPDRP